MSKGTVKRVSFAIASMVCLCSVLAASSAGAATAVPDGSTLNGHPVMVDGTGKIVPWLPAQDQAYGQVAAQAWNYLLTLPANSCGNKPAYYCFSYQNPDTQLPVGWPHNPAGLYAMLIESALEYYQYSGDSRVLQLAQNVADYQLSNGMTLPSDDWANVPYASGDAGSLSYQGASYGNSSGSGDGSGVIEPDKVGELGHGFAQLYKLTGNQTYLTAAINAADALAGHVRPATLHNLPGLFVSWPRTASSKNSTPPTSSPPLNYLMI